MVPTDPNPQISFKLALEYIGMYFILTKEVSGTWGFFKTSKGIMKPHLWILNHIHLPHLCNYSQVDQSLNLRKATRRETASNFSTTNSKVRAESRCEWVGSIEKGLRQWNAILSRFLFEFLMCVIEELRESKLVIMLKMYYREGEQVLQICFKVSHQVGQWAAEDRLHPLLPSTQSEWRWDTRIAWQKGKSEEINGQVGAARSVCSCMRKVWVERRAGEQSSDQCCILK